MKWVGPVCTCPTRGKLFWYVKALDLKFLPFVFMNFVLKM